MPPSSVSIENIIIRHEDRITQSETNYHNLDKNVAELRKDVKSVLDKLDDLAENNKRLESELKHQDSELDKRVSMLEKIHTNREWWLNFIVIILKWIAKLWWFWILLILCIFAFDLEIKVQNPHLVDFFLDAVKNKI